MDIYIFRHGQTEMNVAQRWQGSGIDSLLTDTGKEQALSLGHKIKSYGITKIYCSPLLRAVQTANILAEENSLFSPVIILKDLRECSFGDLEGKTSDAVEEQYKGMLNDFLWPTKETWNMKFPNGESKKEVFDRVMKALRYVVACNKFERYPVGVVCHAGVISALSCGLGLSNVSYENCAILHLMYDFDNDKFCKVD